MAKTGNTAMMRDALRQISLALWSEIDPGCNDDCCAPKRALARLADAALAAPARNCDKYGIDDIKEMDADFGAFCRQYGAKDGENCVGCPIKPMDNLCCHSAWMLLPAEGGDHA